MELLSQTNLTTELQGKPKEEDSDALSREEVGQVEDDPYTCCFFWYPRWAQVFLSPAYFLVAVCLAILADAVSVGALIGVITTLEIRYRLTAANIGLIVTVYSLGSLIGLPILSYFGGRPGTRRPRWIAVGVMVMAIGTMLTSLPQFLFGKYDPLSSSGGEVASQACPMNEGCDVATDDQNEAAYWLINTGLFISGLGYADVVPLGLSYIDDNCNTETTALYAGIMESMYGIGTLFGFLISSGCLTLWVDFYQLEPDETIPSPDHPTWVGAWWLGMLSCGAFLFICSFPLFGFPVMLPKRYAAAAKDETPTDGDWKAAEVDDEGSTAVDEDEISKRSTSTNMRSNQDDDDDGGTVKGFFKTVYRLLTNPVFAFLTVGMSFQIAIVFGFGTFVAKYLESQFETTAALADVLTGIVLVPPYGIGWVLGGLIIRKTKMTYLSMFYFSVVCVGVSLSVFVILFFVGCNNPDIAGVSVDYPGQSGSDVQPIAQCNAYCNCTLSSYNPVCDETNDVIYLSACFAGCNDSVSDVHVSFANCSCLGGEQTTTVGLCASSCVMLVPFVVLIAIQTLAITMAGVPQVILLLRFVDSKDKASTIGINRFFTSIGGLIGPLLYGVFVDGSCTVWQTACGETGNCLVYDIDLYRYSYMGVSVVLGLIGMLFTIPVWYLVRKDGQRRQGRMTTLAYRLTTDSPEL